MIVIDTNVVSEALRKDRDPVVIQWLNSQSIETVYLTTVSLAELLTGIAIMPDGKRKHAMDAELNTLVATLFGSRMLAFDREAAVTFSFLMSAARKVGRSVSLADGQIGAIAEVRGFSVATRDTTPFEAMGLPVINPWKTV